MAKETEVFILGGCGHVGLPLGIMMADAGIRVKLYDIHPERLAMVRRGKMPFIEYGAQPILDRVLNKTLFIAKEISELRNSDALVITVGTPIDEYLNPKTGPLFEVIKQISPHLRDGQHLIVRSTVCPGMTRELRRLLPAKVHLSNCPERISQGYAVQELTQLPQLVSGFSKEAVEFSSRLFRKLGCDITVLEVEEAELAKLYLNAWRYIHFAIANQFYMMAVQRGVDFFKMHKAMTGNYARGKDLPLPGFTAGPCLLKDTLQLASLSSRNFVLGQAAMQINEGLPIFIVEELKKSFDLSKETVGILGMAFKADVDDTRDSLAYKLKKLLFFYGAKVLCSDPLVKDPSFVTPEELFKKCRIIVIGAPHTAYKSLRFPAGKQIVDVWGMTKVKKPAAATANGARRAPKPKVRSGK
jgi:UDP-N-acetyl-D-mannosaminuronic acid dehydrogenase